jgi:opacity protein-like surface antigen
MIRTVNLVGLLLCFSFSFGQSNVYFQAGINYSMLQKPVITFDHTEFGSEFSYTLGAGLKKNLSSRLSCSLGLSYYHYKIDVAIDASSAGGYVKYRYDLGLQYISFCILPEYSFGDKRIFYVNVGPYISYLANALFSGTAVGGRIDGLHFNREISDNFNEDFRRMDFGFLASAGLRLKASEGISILPQLRYNFGLIGIEEPYDPDGGWVMAACYQGRKMRALCFLVEFDFRIKQ